MKNITQSTTGKPTPVLAKPNNVTATGKINEIHPGREIHTSNMRCQAGCQGRDGHARTNNLRHGHPFLESEAYRKALSNLPKGPAASQPQSGHWQPGRWAKILLLLLSLFATLWLGWEALSQAITTFAAHLQAIWWELNAN